jgi:hypothetical protein
VADEPVDDVGGRQQRLDRELAGGPLAHPQVARVRGGAGGQQAAQQQVDRLVVAQLVGQPGRAPVGVVGVVGDVEQLPVQPQRGEGEVGDVQGARPGLGRRPDVVGRDLAPGERQVVQAGGQRQLPGLDELVLDRPGVDARGHQRGLRAEHLHDEPGPAGQPQRRWQWGPAGVHEHAQRGACGVQDGGQQAVHRGEDDGGTGVRAEAVEGGVGDLVRQSGVRARDADALDDLPGALAGAAEPGGLGAGGQRGAPGDLRQRDLGVVADPGPLTERAVGPRHSEQRGDLPREPGGGDLGAGFRYLGYDRRQQRHRSNVAQPGGAAKHQRD